MSATAMPTSTVETAAKALPLADGVLLASHGGDASEAAARFARAFAARRQVPMEVLGVVEPIPSDLRDYAPDVDRFLKDYRQALSDTLNNLLARTAIGPDAPIAIEEGLPADRIAHRAGIRGAALIVLGIGRHTAVDRLLGVETAIAVLRRAPVPVLAVTRNATTPIHTIVIATDFSPASQRSARLAMAFAAEDATVHLVHAWPWMDMAGSGAPVWRRVYQAGAQHLFDEMIRELPIPPQGRIVTHLENGEPLTVVRELARDQHADLVALGSQGLGFIERLTIGSVAETVLRTGECSVLIAPPTPAEKE
jgi:nucleotide-binding universal stress UspA family protein